MEPTIWILVYLYAGLPSELKAFATLDGAVAHAKRLIHDHWEINRTHIFKWDDDLRSASCDCLEHDIMVWETAIPESFLAAHIKDG